MAHTLYDGTIVVLEGILRTLSHILSAAETQRPNDPDSFLAARLHDDMYPLADQIRLATKFSALLAARLTAQPEPTAYDNNPTTLAEGQDRIAMVLKLLREADKAVVNAQGEESKPTPMGPGVTVEMSGAKYAHLVVLPNVYFHLTTAYGILRKEGVPLGKRDYYEGFFPGMAGGNK
ncbi:DUF1993 domain-containing protein [Aspergillus homomorphus CBS 101889]|uniref:DUF1993 domain-containing protein n=1 Tax=Aspergillus homomorphus (strain CBS 101889) TaxID=1450537 RepID=A0A395IBK0_ASPHC|nr:hypothetical protein BO97DRAFT_402014 [Aspergillus homomorphus CBS 101889]RAL17401.1 hypothetical protein BO97DRAFT_402014 [Aspergillus homomorphus CBS 101889]